MSEIRTRTKIEVVVTILLLCSLSVVSVTSVTRTISDSNDNFYTFIRNSNGNYWEVSSSNIQKAIDDLNNNSGTVYLPGNTTITTMGTITVWNNVKLELQGSTIKPSISFDVFRLRENSQIMNGRIDCSDITMQDEHACIKLNGDDQIEYGSTGVFNMHLIGGGHYTNTQGTAIYLYCDGGGTQIDNLMWCTFDNIQTNYFTYGIRFNVSGATNDYNSFANGHIFNNFMMNGDEQFISLKNTANGGNDTNGNIFSNFECEVWSTGENILYCSGKYNQFEIMGWDWNNNNAHSGKTAYYFSSNSQYNYLRYYLDDDGDGDETFFVDNGYKNNFLNFYESYFKTQSIESNSGTLYLNRKTNGGVSLFEGFDSNQVNRPLRIYSNNSNYINYQWQTVSGTDYFTVQTYNDVKYSIYGDGNVEILGGTDDNDDITIWARGDDLGLYADDRVTLYGDYDDSGSGYVGIDDILRLVPRNNAPDSPCEGMIYVNSNDHHIYCYLSGSWSQLD